jgi:hypothetical protein
MHHKKNQTECTKVEKIKKIIHPPSRKISPKTEKLKNSPNITKKSSKNLGKSPPNVKNKKNEKQNPPKQIAKTS